MRDSRASGAGLLIAIALVLVLLAGGGATFMWQRQQMLAMRQEAILQRERAEVEAARARVVAEQQELAAAQMDPAVAEQPNGHGENPESIECSVREVLQSQMRAWNSGDIDQFMDAYWKSEDLTFSSGGRLTRTWQGTLENYKKRYPSRREMGTLSFENLEVLPLGMEAALVLGEWQLRRESQDLGGNFTLIFRHLDDQWVIVHDHTSRAGEP